METTRNDVIDECIKAILSGSFLHDQAPTAQFAREVAAMLERMKDDE